MKAGRWFLAALLAAACSLSALAQQREGVWFFSKNHAIKRSGMVEGDVLVFSRPVSTLPAGSYIQFDVSIENTGEKAPLHYVVEFFEDGKWVCDSSFVYQDGLSDYSFRTVTSAVKHPSTFMAVHQLGAEVRDSLKVRCRVCSPYATDGSLLSAEDEANSMTVKPRGYVGAYLMPLGSGKGFQEKRILLIGNSFTYYFGEPYMLQEIAFSQGWILQVNASLKGGQTYRQHCGLEMTRAQCEMELPYDFAVIQGQSQEPGKYAAAPDSLADVRKAFCELHSLIKEMHPDCRVFIESTWAYPGVSNGGFASLEEFDARLDEGTTLIAAAAGCERSLVGLAFKTARELCPEVSLLDKDDKHQSAAGSYLKACITWLEISGRTKFKGAVPSCGLPEADAAALRAAAEAVAAGLAAGR